MFDFFEGGLKIRKIGKNWTSHFWFLNFCHAVVVRYVPELIFPELGNRPRWGKTRYKTDYDSVVKKSAKLGTAHFPAKFGPMHFVLAV